MMLTAEALLAGADTIVDVKIPSSLLAAAATDTPRPSSEDDDRCVRLKPLTVNDLRLIVRAARDNDDLTAALMVHRSLVEPVLTLAQVSAMPLGLMQFLLREVNRLSGITAGEEEIALAIEDPLARASLHLSQAFGWTPQDIGRLTMGEVLTHLQFLKSA
jgi:hypothetical protein